MLAKVAKIYEFLVCNIYGLKIRSCKVFDKFQVWSHLMKIRRFWPTQWSPDQTKSFLTMKMVSNVPNIHLGIYNNYHNFHPLIFYGWTRLREVGADLPPLVQIGLNVASRKAYIFLPLRFSREMLVLVGEGGFRLLEQRHYPRTQCKIEFTYSSYCDRKMWRLVGCSKMFPNSSNEPSDQ